jgi:CheY-like chemotaxis protein
MPLRNAPPTALIADDDPDFRHLLQTFLEEKNCQALTTDNGRDAVAIAGRKEIQLLLTDIEMPEMNGVTAISTLRQAGFVQPILALTANTAPWIRPHVLAAGADECLHKPVSLTRLDQWLDDALNSVIS